MVWNDFFLLAKLTRQKISVLGTKKNSWQIKIQLSKCSISKTEHQLNESKRRHLSIFVDFLCRTGMKVFKTSRQLHLQTSEERLVVQSFYYMQQDGIKLSISVLSCPDITIDYHLLLLVHNCNYVFFHSVIVTSLILTAVCCYLL